MGGQKVKIRTRHAEQASTPRFVAAVSSSHNRDLRRGKEHIHTAAAIGCDAVKFQLFRLPELFAPEALKDNPDLTARGNWELPLEYLPELALHARECGIEFGCTPFYIEAVAELEPYVHFFNIASYELLWRDLLRACARTGKPVVLSTGMAVLEEIDDAVKLLRKNGCRDLTLLHCVAAYPSPVELSNLAAMNTLRQRFPGVQIGWSDHSGSEAVIHRAVHAHRASMIECHLDLGGEKAEYGGHCWLPQALHRVIQGVRLALSAEGDGVKRPADGELTEREWRADPRDGLRPLRRMRAGLVRPRSKKPR